MSFMVCFSFTPEAAAVKCKEVYWPEMLRGAAALEVRLQKARGGMLDARIRMATLPDLSDAVVFQGAVGNRQVGSF